MLTAMETARGTQVFYSARSSIFGSIREEAGPGQRGQGGGVGGGGGDAAGQTPAQEELSFDCCRPHRTAGYVLLWEQVSGSCARAQGRRIGMDFNYCS